MVLPAVQWHHPSNVTSPVLAGLTPIIPLCSAIADQLGCPRCPLAGGRTMDPEQFGPWGSDQVSAQLLQPPQLPSAASHVPAACRYGDNPSSTDVVTAKHRKQPDLLQQPQKPAGPFSSSPSAWPRRSAWSHVVLPQSCSLPIPGGCREALLLQVLWLCPVLLFGASWRCWPARQELLNAAERSVLCMERGRRNRAL